MQMENSAKYFNLDVPRGDFSVYKSNGATRISVPGEHFRGSASLGSMGQSYPDAREIFVISKKLPKKLEKCIILGVPSK